MYLAGLRLSNFRNHEYLNLSFGKNGAIFFGPNGSGKTNIIESIYMLAFAKSFRNIINENVILFEKDLCEVEAVFFDKNKLKNTIKIAFNKKKRPAF
ncbi:MAG: AAA family ATPase [Spirochaetes bacterium]|nr:AAA family ATPase [Spirochaetota bacterium]